MHFENISKTMIIQCNAHLSNKIHFTLIKQINYNLIFQIKSNIQEKHNTATYINLYLNYSSILF